MVSYLSLPLAEEYEKIGILHYTEVISKLKERMDEIDFLIYHFTGQKSKKQQRQVKKIYKDEEKQDKEEETKKLEKIQKKIPKSLRIYVEVNHFPNPSIACYQTVHQRTKCIRL